MEKEAINIVWLKRDIRTQDHAAWDAASKSDLRYIVVYIFEPSMLAYPDTSLRHIQFQYHSLLDIGKTLKKQCIYICYAEAETVFKYLSGQFDLKSVFSYQESGTDFSYSRDKQLSIFFKESKIQWLEFQRDGIIRGIKNREGWDQAWFANIKKQALENEIDVSKIICLPHVFVIHQHLLKKLEAYPAEFQPAGESYAYKYLDSFVKTRGKNYSKHISKPTESRISCSRLSPYLAWGNISIKIAFQIMAHQGTQNPIFKFGLSNAMTRLKWHCHFIQKFENQCNYEFKNLNSGYDVFPWNKNSEHLKAWQKGQTGIPFVDANMRCVAKTGWINFRMRAMVVSFLTHHLMINWKEGVYTLAKYFLDYEPGIHFTQFQMQAGTTGINTIRIYNPIKQSQDHDPDGVFIKKWCPELENIPTTFIHEPWKMSDLEQQLYGVVLGETYPNPIVLPNEVIKSNRDLLWGQRKNEIVKTNNKTILKKHARPQKTAS
ncbi:MAG: deoxyribodipyrimidine photo-lyase/cryptochrome family protein [Leadbetterella sp.]